MKLPRLRTVLLLPIVLFGLAYIAGAIALAWDDNSIEIFEQPPASYSTIVIFGASGTAGDGILKAALANSEIGKIHVVSRRATPRIEAGVAARKVQMTLHKDYLNYSAIHEQVAEADAVYWAIGQRAIGVDESTYGTIHVDFPARFVAEWLDVSQRPSISFHYISSSDISADSTAMWAREKFRAEKTLFGLAKNTKLRIVAYRPDYIGPTDEQAHLGQRFLYWFFAPVGVAVKAEQIGNAMFEVTARGRQFANGDKLNTRSILQYSDAFDRRQAVHRVKFMDRRFSRRIVRVDIIQPLH
ncbi:MAG: hypothetical protein IPG25_10300 [Proteobacteria bacterium]|nr:hypothetical protein [Pseudomonadota bacterium]